MAFAVKIGAIATPCALVVTELTPFANVPLAPVGGAANVTGHSNGAAPLGTAPLLLTLLTR